MSLIKTPEEISVMKEGGSRLGTILKSLLQESAAGVTLVQIEKKALALIAQADGTASFQTVEGYKWATCLCVNDVVVHGIPTDYVLKPGDILTIDVGMLYGGLHTDTAWTKIISGEPPDSDKERFLKVGEQALDEAINQARTGNHIGHISQAIQSEIEGARYGVVKTLVGHGIGVSLHEAPQVPGILQKPVEETLVLKEGMVLAIEVIYAQGSGKVEYVNNDGWSIATQDHSLTAVFEHTVAITGSGAIILTQARD